MGSFEKPQTPVPPKAAKAASATPASAVREAVSEAARSAVQKAVFEKRPYLKMAFSNPYNLSLLVGALAASVITLNPVLALGALGLEALWLLHGPESSRLRHLLWDPRLEKLRKIMEAAERAERLKGVGDAERQRVEALVARQEEIRRLAAQNPSFTGDLLRNELVKTDRLVDAFVEMAITCARYERYLESVDLDALEKDRRRYEAQARGSTPEEPQSAIARKNLAIVLKRLEKMQEIRRYLSVAKGQLDLIENSFQLIADQIVTMQSPQELSGQLDELLDGVEAIRETARDTERVLGAIEQGVFSG